MEEWIGYEKQQPSCDGKYRVILSDNSIRDAYYYMDHMAWTAFYGQKTCGFWDSKTHEALHDVVSWKDIGKSFK